MSMNPEELEAFGAEIQAVGDRVTRDLGERDARYIHELVAAQRRAEVAGRALLFAGAFPPAWISGVALLTEEQPWRPVHLPQPLCALVQALTFEWAVAVHDLELDRVLRGEKKLRQVLRQARPLVRKAALQVLCGHFPDGVQMYLPRDVEGETRDLSRPRRVLQHGSLLPAGRDGDAPGPAALASRTGESAQVKAGRHRPCRGFPGRSALPPDGECLQISTRSPNTLPARPSGRGASRTR